MKSIHALLLLDLQNEMVDPKGKIGASGLAAIVEQRGVLDHARTVLAAARDAQWAIAHIRLGFQPGYPDCLSVAPRIARLKASGAAILGEWGTEFPEKVAPRPGELVVTKQAVNPFFNTGLLTWLLRNGVERVALGGVATNLVVESSARAADDAGFAVTVIEDSCASPNPAWHQFAIEQMLPLFGRVVSSGALLAEMG